MKDTTWSLCHTAGHEKHGQSAVYDNATGQDIAIVYDGDRDGKILAAAPQLLEACQRLHSDIPWVHNAAHTQDIEALRAICLAYANVNNNYIVPALIAAGE